MQTPMMPPPMITVSFEGFCDKGRLSHFDELMPKTGF
jgi:hypothetical protein